MNAADSVVSVVVPLQEDAGCLAGFVRSALAVLRRQTALYEIILIDDGARDGTAAVADRLLRAEAGLRLIRLSRRFGPDVAVMAGLDAALGDVVIVIRPDCDPTSAIPEVLRQVRAGGDVCLGLAEDQPRDPLPFRLCRAAFALCWRAMVGRALPPSHCSLFGLTRRAVNAITRLKMQMPHLSVLSCGVGFEQRTFPYRKALRTPAAGARGLLESIDLGLHLLVTNSRSPYRLVSGLGFIAALLNLLYVAYVIAVNLVKTHVAEGWTTLSLQNSAMFMLVFLALGLLAEYASRSQSAAGREPLYHVLEERGSSVVTAGAELRNVVGQDAPPEDSHVAA